MLLFMITFFVAAIFITIYLRFPQFRILKKIKECKNKKTKQAFYLSLGTNLGVGNLIGVAAAIYMGGSGVIFWMALFAFFASSLAYLENYYAILAQVKTKYGTFSGTCYTIIKFLNGKSAKYIALIFSIFLILTNTLFFPPIQINAVVSVFPINYKLIFSIFLIIVILFIVFGGIKRILKITDKFVFIFTIMYFIILVVGILFKINDIKDVINDILINAFNLKCVGVSSFFSMFNIAITKSLFSNEAGLGSAPMAHASTSETNPVKQGLYGIFEVFMDTIIICTMTSLTLLCGYLCGVEVTWGVDAGTELIANSYSLMFGGQFGSLILAVCISLFAFSTILSWALYGSRCCEYLLGTKSIKYYQVLFMIVIVIGACLKLDVVWKIADTLNGFMAIPNLIALLFLNGQVARETNRYFKEGLESLHLEIN